MKLSLWMVCNWRDRSIVHSDCTNMYRYNSASSTLFSEDADQSWIPVFKRGETDYSRIDLSMITRRSIWPVDRSIESCSFIPRCTINAQKMLLKNKHYGSYDWLTHQQPLTCTIVITYSLILLSSVHSNSNLILQSYRSFIIIDTQFVTLQ